MKKLILTILAVSGAAAVSAQAAGTTDRQARGDEFRAEMQALIAGEGLSLEDLTRLMQEHSEARFASLDANSDGVVKLEEFVAAADQHARARFQQMKPDEDGVVIRTGHRDKDQTKQVPEQRAERLNERADRQFSRLDTDGDGAISPEEFKAGLQARHERLATEASKDRAEGRRGRRDRKHDDAPAGFHQTRGELRSMLRNGVTVEQFSDFMQKQATGRFKALDIDGNGELTSGEFNARLADHAEKTFARMDSNKDGLVTAADDSRGVWRHGPRK